MTPEDALYRYVLRLGDNALIIAQRKTERVTLEPELEEELANANFALDYLGQARMFYSYAGELEGRGRGEDDFAYRRDEGEFQNFLLVEQPNGHFGDAIVCQVLFGAFYALQLEALAACRDARLAAIAARAVKEIRYHLRHAGLWLVRLGRGTELSHARVAASLENQWRFTGEFFAGDEVDDIVRSAFDGPDLETIRGAFRDRTGAMIREAGLEVPGDVVVLPGGREGRHSEHLGYLVAEMQYLARGFPGATW